MAQITQGIRSLLSMSAVYDAVQDLLGAKRSRQQLVEQYIRPDAGDTILDVGCGTCAILDHLPESIRYVGIDLSPAYIETARERHSGRGTFHCMDIAAIGAPELPAANIAVAVGLLHHLDDAEAAALLVKIASCLAPGGRLVTIDPCFDANQSRLARYLISKDRGQNVRHARQYAALAEPAFKQVKLTVRHDLARIPYTHALLECSK